MQIFNIRSAKFQNLNVSRLVFWLSLPNPLNPGIKSRMKMWLEQPRQAMLQRHLSILLPSEVRPVLEVLRYMNMNINIEL